MWRFALQLKSFVRYHVIGVGVTRTRWGPFWGEVGRLCGLKSSGKEMFTGMKHEGFRA